MRPALGWTSVQGPFRGTLSYRRKRSCFGVFGEGRVRSRVWQGNGGLVAFAASGSFWAGPGWEVSVWDSPGISSWLQSTAYAE